MVQRIPIFTLHLVFPFRNIAHLSQLMNEYWYIVINQNLYFIQISLVLHGILSLQIPSELPYDIYLLCLINILLAVTFSDFSCFFEDLDSFEEYTG